MSFNAAPAVTSISPVVGMRRERGEDPRAIPEVHCRIFRWITLVEMKFGQARVSEQLYLLSAGLWPAPVESIGEARVGARKRE